ncbi:hypothetical protein Hanom_Chr14g01265391 [Helianthus anomalus]
MQRNNKIQTLFRRHNHKHKQTQFKNCDSSRKEPRPLNLDDLISLTQRENVAYLARSFNSLKYM